MTRIALLVAFSLSFALAGSALAQERGEPNEVRHSGRILVVAPDGSAIVLEELGTWTGPGTGLVTRSIRLTPRTSIRLIERADRWEGDRTSMPGWDVEMMEATSLRPGDFVTVTTDDDGRDVAVALLVVRPDTE
jgi:hypothetical protein